MARLRRDWNAATARCGVDAEDAVGAADEPQPQRDQGVLDHRHLRAAIAAAHA